MAEEKNIKAEGKVKEPKKLEEFKNSEENKKIIAGTNGENEKKEKSEPAVEQSKNPKAKKKEETPKVELEREYVVPLKKGSLKVPRYRRAGKAVKVLKEFLARHMRVENRDLRKVKIDTYLNNELWFRGIKKPANKIKVKAVKKEGIVYVELADVPEAVKFAKAWDEKRNAVDEKVKVKTPKVAPEAKKTEEEKVEEKEDVKAGAELDAKVEKAMAKTQKHTAQGKHAKKSMPVRKALKK
ncbi:50S ribosomal protein L31e [Candidatus Pacearchaeota archaeon]|nr:50S ribosomal protein L31e [Candidatus Pacearchaeota archaeon]